MIKNKNFLILSLCTIFSSFGAQELVSETKHLQLAFSKTFGGGRACWLHVDRIVVFADCDEPMKVLDAKTGKLLTIITNTKMSTHWWKSFSSGYQHVAILCADGIEILETGTGLCIKKIVEKVRWPLTIWSPNNRYLAIFEDGGSSRMLYDMQSDKLNQLDSGINNFRKDLTTISWCPTSQFFATYDKECIFLWDIQEHAPIRTFKHQDVKSLHWATDGLTLITVSYDCVKLWDIKTGEIVHTHDLAFDGIKSDGFFFIELMPDDKQLLIISNNGVIRLYDVYTGNVRIIGQHKGVWTIGLSPDKKYLLTSGDQLWKLWAIEAGKCSEPGQKLQGAFACMDDVVCYALSNDYLAIPSRDQRSLQLWDVHTGALVQEEPGITGLFAWSPDGKRLLTQSYPEGIKVWDLV